MFQNWFYHVSSRLARNVGIVGRILELDIFFRTKQNVYNLWLFIQSFSDGMDFVKANTFLRRSNKCDATIPDTCITLMKQNIFFSIFLFMFNLIAISIIFVSLLIINLIDKFVQPTYGPYVLSYYFCWCYVETATRPIYLHTDKGRFSSAPYAAKKYYPPSYPTHAQNPIICVNLQIINASMITKRDNR